MLLIHATTVAIDGAGAVLRGSTGSGKSDLALRLIDGGARLVADDRTELRRDDSNLIASAPQAIAGRLEVRGVGILEVPSAAEAPVRLVVDLVPPELVERLPEAATEAFLGLAVPLIRLAPFEASAAAKLRLAVAAAARGILPARD